MNRIICDICGSEYSETEERCPICSYPRQGNEKLVAASAADAVRTRVKGGRFNSKNVKKRQTQQEPDPNRPLLVVIALLLVAIVLVSAYIGLRFFRGREERPQLTAPTTIPTETTTPPAVPCAGIVLDSAVVDLETLGEQKQLAVLTIPEDTTDALTFQSADPAVATVSETGVLTAVGPGQTTITITCGSVEKTCTVVCWFQEETTAPTETTAPQPTVAGELSLSRSDVSCFHENETFTLTVEAGGTALSPADVTWTSSDPDVASVENGVVTAVGKGTAAITVAYNGKTASCTVRCRFEDATWTASATDVTLDVDHSFRLTVTNDAGETAEATWTMSTEGVVSVSGEVITGRDAGTVTLTTTVDGVTLTCIVRVREP